MTEATSSDSGPALTVEQQLADSQALVANLEAALENSRAIGMAIGIVMERCHISQDEAFNLLVLVSQGQHRKLRDVASELVFTGVIPDA